MINRKHFGRRTADFRRNQGLSQADLADKLGVTAQAVSKWETGATLPDIELLLELSKLFGVSVNELLEDNSLISKLAVRPFETKEHIACFVPLMDTDPEWAAWERDMQQEGWIDRNWRTAWGQSGGWPDQQDNNRLEKLKTAGKIAQHGGVILEIGAGPGGGYMPYVLQSDQSAQIIVSDLSHMVVGEWKRFLDRELDSPHLCYAAMDFCHIPFVDSSVDVICDHGAVINCIGDRGAALKEIYRVLKLGGLYVSLNGFVTKQSISSLPEDAKQTLRAEYPEIFDSLYEETVLAGFRKIDSTIQGTWTTDEDESGVADLAKSLGVTVEFTEYVRFCEK